MSVATPLFEPTLDSVQQAFDHWRASRTNRSHTPISLQRRAAALLGSYRASHICQALKINDAALKRWSRSTSTTPVLSSVGSAFVELPTELASDANAQSSCGSASGTLLSIELDGAIQLRIDGPFNLEQILHAVRVHQQGARS